ncbi:trifunctional serine/threonine-protein kinase/ATP-binding protein/sensor histidine kinase [Acanthopleuribacter pedis]|uniref:histidine kinase n=1 Tax=Acanthopleuribacter pedis TaxID=442870 RepID=A0A8J7U2T0_9BACT|nr:trifunctional serine/threonine-protein kinase/ATP-binding protein/sensor histidine kinase [Acanthopleuribacter pedis]MBO1319638.1 AAA family ATPase [Acanthopleuribacter pedis]
MIQLAGYDFGKLLFEGKRSRVYRMTRLRDGLSVIIKVPTHRFPSSGDLKRFRREYEIGHQFDSEYIVQYHSLEPFQHGLALVMEDFGAVGLKEVIPDRGMNLLPALKIAVALANGLYEIHRLKVIHRDIKPRNVVINQQTGLVKFIDFGISSRSASGEMPKAGLTRHAPEGTLAYMSPEQTGRMNRGTDYRTDFYSLGCLLYELLCGEPPFYANDPLEYVHAHIAKKPIPLVRRRYEISEGISALIDKLMAKNPDDRYQSCAGLAYDLKHCLAEYEAREQVATFDLGTKDVSDQFRIPERLYGREKECRQLVGIFQQVSEGGRELVLLSGYSGVGKTSLVYQVQRPLLAKKGFFISGKFEPLKRDIAYSAVSQAFKGLVRHLLGEGDQQIEEWRNRILKAIGPNGSLVLDVIPELEHLIGRQNEVPMLGPRETRYRFNQVFREFVGLFAGKDHPLIFFLDDLQWADSASLRLLEELANAANLSHFLFIGAYRDNEVPARHPLRVGIDQLRRDGVEITSISLKPLDLFHTQRLIADTLHSDLDSVAELASIVHSKTHGNPFFTNEFLKIMHRDRLLYFDEGQPAWCWDLARIRATNISENVVEFLVKRLALLSSDIQEALKTAACLGSIFSPLELSLVLNAPINVLETALWQAVDEGILEAQIEAEPDQNEEEDKAAYVHYRFRHDRIHQAAYSLIDDADRDGLHLHIGRTLLDHLGEAEREERLFSIVHQLNHGFRLITDAAFKQRLIELNLAAALRAKHATAFHAAIEYLETALALLPKDPDWREQGELRYQLVRELAENTYSAREFEKADRLWEDLWGRAPSDMARAEICHLRLTQTIADGRLDKALDYGYLGLEALGVNLPRRPTKLSLVKQLAVSQWNLRGVRPEDLMQRKLMVDSRAQLVTNILMEIALIGYLTRDQNLLVLANLIRLNMFLKYGNCPEAASTFTTYGLILTGAMGSYTRGYRFGKLGLALNRKFDDIRFDCKIMTVFALTILPWNEHWKYRRKYFKRAIHVGLQSGDLMYTSFACIFYTGWDPGMDLGAEIAEAQTYINIIRENRYQDADRIARLLQQRRLNLTATTKGPYSLSDANFDEDKLLEEMEASTFTTGLANYYLIKMELHFLYEDYRGALFWLEKLRPLERGFLGLISSVMTCLYSFLTLSQLMAVLEPKERKSAWKSMKKDLKRMGRWAQHCPLNFEHLHYLMQADWARLKGNYADAALNFDHAVKCAKTNEYPFFEALANVLAAKFFLQSDQEKIAALYLREGHYCFQRLGALAKLRSIEERYPLLLSAERSLVHTRHLADTFSSLTTESTFSTTGEAETEPGGSVTSADTFDLVTVSKSALAISSEIDLDLLIAKMMTIMMESAGAERGMLVLEHQGRLMVEAAAVIDIEVTTKKTSEPLAGSELLSQNIVRYVVRTGETVILRNATEEGLFTQDGYILNRRPKSLLCTPIRHKDHISGVLYLENNLITNAFTENRIRMLNLLLSQAAVSLENARLYSDTNQLNQALKNEIQERISAETEVRALNETLEQRVAERTEQLEQAQKELLEKAHKAGMADIATSVLHNVGNILNSVTTASQMIRDIVNRSRLQGLFRANELLRQNMDDLEQFIGKDPKGKDLMRFYLGFDQILKKESSEIIDHVRRLNEKVNSIRDVIMAQQSYAAGGFHDEWVSLETVLESALDLQSLMLTANHVHIEKTIQATPPVLIQRVKLVHVIVNLLKNAKEAMDHLPHDQRGIQIHLGVSDKEVCLSVKDVGVGIAPDHLERIFHHGFTTKAEGHGFGLHSCANSVNEMNGRMWVESEGEGRGATFLLAFPVASQEVTKPATADDGEPAWPN